MKMCKKCKISKTLDQFYLGNNSCKQCKIEYQKKNAEKNKDKIREYKKEYGKINKDSISEKNRRRYEENGESIKNKSKKFYEENKEYKLIYQKKYAEKNKNKISEYKKEYQQENKEKINLYKRSYNNNRRKGDPVFKLKFSISRMIRNSLKNNGFVKKERTNIILGMPIEEFKIYLENKFTDKMCWENYGVVWDIDHIVPLSTAITEEDVLRLNHYTNLQPLDSYINRNVKKDRLDFYE